MQHQELVAWLHDDWYMVWENNRTITFFFMVCYSYDHNILLALLWWYIYGAT